MEHLLTKYFCLFVQNANVWIWQIAAHLRNSGQHGHCLISNSDVLLLVGRISFNQNNFIIVLICFYFGLQWFEINSETYTILFGYSFTSDIHYYYCP